MTARTQTMDEAIDALAKRIRTGTRDALAEGLELAAKDAAVAYPDRPDLALGLQIAADSIRTLTT